MNAHDRVVLVMEEPRGPSQLVEVPITTVLARIPFPDVQQLRSQQGQRIIIKAMRLITSDALVGGVLNQLPTAPSTELQKMVLVLYSEGWEKGQFIPINTLNDFNVDGTTNTHRYNATKFNNWSNVDWPKSYIQFAAGTQSVIGDAGYVVMLDVEYIRLNSDGTEYNSEA